MAEDFSGVIDFTGATADDFGEELVRVAKRLDRELQTRFAAFDQARGRFTTNEANLGRLVDVRDQIHAAILNAGYADAVEVYFTAFPELQERVLQAWRNLGVEPAFSTVDTAALDVILAADLDDFANVAEQGADLIRSNLVQAVTSGRNYRDFAEELRDFLRGAEDLRDKAGAGMFRHANTLAQTSMDELHATMDDQLAKNAGIKRFKYVGGIIATTRQFCRERNGNIYTRDEIEAMDNGQTGTGSVMIARGGFNCRHQWLPVVD